MILAVCIGDDAERMVILSVSGGKRRTVSMLDGIKMNIIWRLYMTEQPYKHVFS